jgi:hypothetical protein
MEVKIFGYNSDTESWHCTQCGEDMGKHNPRQLCGKTYCPNVYVSAKRKPLDVIADCFYSEKRPFTNSNEKEKIVENEKKHFEDDIAWDNYIKEMSEKEEIASSDEDHPSSSEKEEISSSDEDGKTPNHESSTERDDS